MRSLAVDKGAAVSSADCTLDDGRFGIRMMERDGYLLNARFNAWTKVRIKG
jgi:hypothetical protein